MWLHFIFPWLVCSSPPDPPLHWMPLARLEKNRSRTPLLPEPTAMDMLAEQLKVRRGKQSHPAAAFNNSALGVEFY